MPHQCTNCGHTFPDGSKEMLSGCPDCGGNKFQFRPAGSNADSMQSGPAPDSPPSTPATSTPPSSSSTSETEESPPETEGVRDESGFVSKELTQADESPAQSSARSEVVSSSELTAAGGAASAASEAAESDSAQATDSTPNPEQPRGSTPESTVDSESDATSDSKPEHSAEESTTDVETEESNLNQLRKELNDQFESIRIVSPGQYELNLMELYDREEYIISLREDGRYVIEVPDGWGDS